MPARLRPVADAPALLIEADPPRVGRTLVIADVHLGLGATKERPGGPPEGSGPRLAESLLSTVRAEAADRVVIAGDIKHPIVGTSPPLRPVVFEFFRLLLASGLNVEVVLGNHDVGLERHLPREVVVRPASGWRYDDVGVFHGHAWPSAAVLRAPTLVVGHLHPGFRLAPSPDDPTGKRRCWVRLELPPPPPRRGRRPRKHEIRSRELIVLPAFNPLAGTEALNRQRPARGRSFLYGRFLSRGVSRAYLLDGTDLGPLTLPVPQPRGRSVRATRPGS
ncbi:MAG: metallophosphoesterase [Thermoplasmata archaeon]